MSNEYNYEERRSFIFTEEGVKMLRKIESTSKYLLEISGAFLFNNVTRDVTGSSWDMQTCIDYLIEQGEIREVKQRGGGYLRVYTK